MEANRVVEAKRYLVLDAGTGSQRNAPDDLTHGVYFVTTQFEGQARPFSNVAIGAFQKVMLGTRLGSQQHAPRGDIYESCTPAPTMPWEIAM